MFSPADEDAINQLVRRMAALGLGHLPVRPHITLAYVPELVPGTIDLQDICWPVQLHAGPAQLVPDTQQAVALMPDRSQLATPHALLHQRLSDAGMPTFDYCTPDVWVPHVSLAYQVPPELHDSAIAAAEPAPSNVTPSAITLFDLQSRTSIQLYTVRAT